MLRRAATLFLATATFVTLACDGSVVDPVATDSTDPETSVAAAG